MIKLLSLFILLYLIALWLDKLFFTKDLTIWRQKLNELWVLINDGKVAGTLSQVNVLICELFDFVYGKEHYSEKRLKRSIVSSLVGMLIFAYLLGIEGISSEFYAFITNFQKDLSPSILVIIIILSSLGPICFNLIPDYFSLIETRLILQYANGKRSGVIILLIIADVLITIFIFLAGVIFFLLFLKFISSMGQHIVIGRNAFTVESFKTIFTSNIGIVFMLTTFMTSFFWIFFVLAYFIILFFNRYLKFTHYLINQLSTSKKPTTVVTTIFSVFVVFLYFIVQLFRTA